MFMFFNTCIYHWHVCQLPLYYSIVHTLYIHGTDIIRSVHRVVTGTVYARWSDQDSESPGQMAAAYFYGRLRVGSLDTGVPSTGTKRQYSD